MKAVAWTTWLGLSVLAGCASSVNGSALCVSAAPPARSGNLLLGRSAWDPSAGDAAQAFAVRSDWPSQAFGYYLDDTSAAFDASYSDQSYFDGLGGGYYGQSGSVRTRVLRR